MGQKGLELAFLAKNNCFQRIFSLAELGVPHPITENHSAQKSLAVWDHIWGMFEL